MRDKIMETMIKEDFGYKERNEWWQNYAYPITNSQTVMLKYEAIYEGELT